jgi:phage FluMu protein Com
MGKLDTLLYACCPICTKPIGKSKRIDGMEMPCPKCGSLLKITIDEEKKVSVEFLQDETKKKP